MVAIKTTLNHLQIYVSDKRKSFPFYRELLTYLGYKIVDEDTSHLGMRNGFTDIWLKETPVENKSNKYSRRNTGVNHIAFGVSKKTDVDKFCKEFLNPRHIKLLYNSPKLFPEYTEKYYAVFFEDPDRIKLEVVFL
jgi:catechol 2,3-dioxygenase-like lactoylglutathione lyase family enzyme